jgi:hypothetical protein
MPRVKNKVRSRGAGLAGKVTWIAGTITEGEFDRWLSNNKSRAGF